MGQQPCCNLCGSVEFMDMRRRAKVRCVRCGSLERTRLLHMHLEKLNLNQSTRVLHFAPEKGMYNYFKEKLDSKNYFPVDFVPGDYPHAEECGFIDLCDLESWDTDSFDVILHSHVLEHSPCNIAYSLFHLDRMLAPGGHHFCVIPFMPGKWEEDFHNLTPDVRLARFGQGDHMRRFGREDIDSHLGKLMPLPEQYDARNDFPEAMLKANNIPEKEWTGFTGSTVLTFRKGDFLLSNR